MDTHCADRVPARPSPRIHAVQRRLESAALRQVIEDYQAGAPTTVLMERYQLGKGTVINILRRAGVDMRGQGLDSANLARATSLYESGMSLKQVAAQFACDAETVRKELRAAGMAMRKPWEGRRHPLEG